MLKILFWPSPLKQNCKNMVKWKTVNKRWFRFSSTKYIYIYISIYIYMLVCLLNCSCSNMFVCKTCSYSTTCSCSCLASGGYTKISAHWKEMRVWFEGIRKGVCVGLLRRVFNDHIYIYICIYIWVVLYKVQNI